MEREIQYHGNGFYTVGIDDQPVRAKSYDVPSLNDLESQINELRATAEANDLRLHQKANGQPRGSQGQGAGDLEYQTALKAKRQYQHAREAEEDERVADSAFLANGGKISELMASKGTYAELHILNKTAEARRLKKLAAGDKLSSEDETWIQEMLGLAGQK